MKFTSKRPAFEYLRKKWTARQRAGQTNFWEKHGSHLDIFTKTLPARQLLVGGLGGLLMLTTPANLSLTQGYSLPNGQDILKDEDKNLELAERLNGVVPEEVRPLAKDEEGRILEILSSGFGFNVTAELEGIRLNRNYGLMGGEQHLYRYPGDNLHSHADNLAEWAMYGPSGIAPGLGAWGYFAPSKIDLTQQDKMREKYYLAIQTFLAPGFSENVARYRDFFKFRKMLVVNPKTGQSVVAVIGDAGPAFWTGKHLGGSPEVMHYAGLAHGSRKGPVLYFFIDDPADQIPLGPIKVISSES